MSLRVAFAVLGDPHIRASGGPSSETPKDSEDRNKALVQKIKEKHKNEDYSFVAICGDLMDRARTKEDDLFNKIWWEEGFSCQSFQKGETPLLCEGIGNHDTDWQQLSKANYPKKYLIPHNLQRLAVNALSNHTNKKISFTISNQSDNPLKSCNNLHYSWSCASADSSERVHFIMLNKFPGEGRGRIGGRKINNIGEFNIFSNDQDRRNSDPDNALIFLRERLKAIGTNEPIFLFHHYGFHFIDEKILNKHWNKEERKEYLGSIKDYNISGIFYGHLHTTKHEVITLPGTNKRVPAICIGNALEGEFLSCVFNSKSDAYSLSITQQKLDFKSNNVTHPKIKVFDGAIGLPEPNPQNGIYVYTLQYPL